MSISVPPELYSYSREHAERKKIPNCCSTLSFRERCCSLFQQKTVSADISAFKTQATRYEYSIGVRRSRLKQRPEIWDERPDFKVGCDY